MHLIDTHCHLNHESLLGSVQDVLKRAKDAGVSTFFVVGWDELSSRKAVELAKTYPMIKAIIGLHPVDSQVDSSLDWIEPLAKENPKEVIAIGEIGLDYHWKKLPEEHALQARHLIQQIDIANRLNLPIVIHCRDAYEAILPILKIHNARAHGVMHCYAGSPILVNEFIQLGFYLSYGGPITFKNAIVARESLKATPLDRMLIETDAPYLTPHPFRGKTNEPSYLPLVLEKLKEIYQIDSSELSKKLDSNVTDLFHVKTI
jgi:TatD DNase family protein